MATTELQITPQQRTIKDLFTQAGESIRSVVPKHLDPERMMRVALVAISRSPDLLVCTPQSLLAAFMQASELGLTVSGSLGEAYLVPYWNKKIQAKEAIFIVGYRGMANLAIRSEHVTSIEAQVVRQGDSFSYEFGTNAYLTHRPARGNDRPLTDAYAIATMKDGSKKFEVMQSDEVADVRSRSQCEKSGPWVTDEAEMWKKTVVRRLCKLLPLSPESVAAIEASDRNEFGDLNISTQEQIKQPRRVSANQIGSEGAAPSNGSPADAGPAEQPKDAAKQEGGEQSQGEPRAVDDRPIHKASYAEQMHDGEEARIQGTLAWDAETKPAGRGQRTSFKLRHDEGGNAVAFSTFGSVPDGLVKDVTILFTCKANAKNGTVYLNADGIEII